MNNIIKINSKYKITALAVIALMIGAGVFYACNKDGEFGTTQSGKLMGSTGIWDCTVTNSIGTITVSEGGVDPCTRYFVNRFWNTAEQRYTGFSHTTEIYNCGATTNLASVEFVATLRDGLITDYTNVNNFILTVDGHEVTATSPYVKDFTYNIIGADGEVIIKTGTILVTCENAINVWNEINMQMEWVGAPLGYDDDDDDGKGDGLKIRFRHYGVGSGPSKYCKKGSGSCWLWHQVFDDFVINFNLFADDIGVFAFVSLVDDDDNGNGNNGEDNRRNIILNFKYKYNTAASLNELLGADRVLVIEEDMVEENGSYLQTKIGTTLPCTIPAGSYPATVITGTNGGIRVILPVIY